MEDIQSFVTKFRCAINAAQVKGEFENDFSFCHFPHGCCGDASYLLGEYFLENGIESTYVCGNRFFNIPEGNFQSHAWLLVEGLIADITGDQFKNMEIYYNYDISDYYGPADDFHNLFEVAERDVHPIYGVKTYDDFYRTRLSSLYRRIKKYL